MKNNRVVIGVRFLKQSFKLSSHIGDVVDSVLGAVQSNRSVPNDFITKFNTSPDPQRCYVQFANESNTTTFVIQPDQVVLTLISEVNNELLKDAQKYYAILWKSLSKIINFGDIRRVGIVHEYEISTPHSFGANSLVSSLTTFKNDNNSTSFNMQFDSIEPVHKGDMVDLEKSAYWNNIYTFFPTVSLDGRLVEKRVTCSLDVQRYYNPAASDPTREIKTVVSRYESEYDKFHTHLKKIGLVQ
ncbi:hypothetical protein [Vibrio coralliilyticus]|uniref:hypothetical protein n=1 Tax=Vibrio coralliilyticus TaxID=190893 RepID=UPI000C17335A|nr:hypothetical protein [Vibrio coralliilyticus]